MSYSDRISADPQIMQGKPVIKGTRLTVELLLRKLSEGASVADLLTMYPHLETADLLAVFKYAADVLAHEEIIDVSAL